MRLPLGPGRSSAAPGGRAAAVRATCGPAAKLRQRGAAVIESIGTQGRPTRVAHAPSAGDEPHRHRPERADHERRVQAVPSGRPRCAASGRPRARARPPPWRARCGRRGRCPRRRRPRHVGWACCRRRIARATRRRAGHGWRRGPRTAARRRPRSPEPRSEKSDSATRAIASAGLTQRSASSTAGRTSRERSADTPVPRCRRHSGSRGPICAG